MASTCPGKPTLSEKLATTRASFMNKSVDGAMGALSARPPGAARPSTSSGRGMRPQSGGRGGGGPNMNAKPQALTCYLCGTQHFSQSLFIHIAACQKKWVQVEQAKLPRERRALPPPPPEVTGELPTDGPGMDRFNASMYAYWDRVSCMVCSICTRSFRPEAFEKHAKVCSPSNPGGPLGMPKAAAGRPPQQAAAKPTGAAASPGTKAAAGGGARPPSSRPPGGGPNMDAKPRAFTCYLCGTSHFSRSLFIHIAQCQKKWLMVEEVKLPRERRALPPPPPELTEDLPSDPAGIDRFNASMYAYWDRVSLIVCRICTRSFRAEPFEKHAKVCTADNPGGPLGLPKGVTPAAAKAAAAAAAASGGGGRGAGGGPNMDAKPRAFMCYLCGTSHFSASLTIHIPQCYEKWLKVEGAKDPRERREPPPPPAELDRPLPSRPEEIDAFNQRMSDVYNGFSLMKCGHCGRSMRPEALTRHQKACTADKPMKSVAGGGAGGSAGPPASGSSSAAPPVGGRGAASGPASAPSEQPEEDEELEQCGHCGRSMRAEALAKHSRVCTADKPMKSVKKSAASPPLSSPPVPPKPSPGEAVPASPSPPAQPRPPGGGGRRSTNPGEPEPAPTHPLPPAPSPVASPSSASSPKGGAPLGGGRPPAAPPTQASSNPPPTHDDQGDAPEEGERVQCETCGRRFIPEAFEKHTRICATVFASKRKAFDSSKARLAGTEAAGVFQAPAGRRPAAGGAASSGPKAGGQQQTGSSGRGPEPAPKWKSQSDSLRSAMENMRQVNAAIARGEPLPPPVPSAPDPSLVQCPHCGRRFNDKAAERHILACASTQHKPKFLKRGTGGSGAGAPQSKPLPNY